MGIPDELGLISLIRWWWCLGRGCIDPALPAAIAKRKDLTKMVMNLDGGAGAILRLSRLLRNMIK